MRACFFTFLFLFTSHFTFSQNIRGKITDVNNNPLEAVNISIIDIKGGETSNKDGNYNISIKANRSYIIAFNFTGSILERKCESKLIWFALHSFKQKLPLKLHQ